MDANDKDIRAKLLDRRLGEPGRAGEYRREVARVLERQQRTLRKEAWAARIGGGGALITAIAMTLAGDLRHDVSLAVSGCFWLIVFLGIVAKYLGMSNRVEILKEIRQVQLQIQELSERVEPPGDAPAATM